MSRKSGYFVVYRDIFRHPVFANILQASLWIYMISSASHQDKTLRFMDTPIFVRRGEMIMPLRVTAKRFKMTYSEMRTFILRMVRRKMITTRTAQLQPTSNHKNRKVTLISIVNYDKFQYVDKEQPHTDHLSQQVLNNNILSNKLNTVKKKSSNGVKPTGNQFGDYIEVKIKGKTKWKHKFKEDMPLKDEL
tara:strand:- start:132 stop:704 length:573 start_codon:yes stop_codon:yes gene_type:complete